MINPTGLSTQHFYSRYIKELSERVGRLENFTQLPDGRNPSPTVFEGVQQSALSYSPNHNVMEHSSRKRTHSVSSGANYSHSMDPTYQDGTAQAMSGSPPDHATQTAPRQPAHEASGYQYQNVASIHTMDMTRDGRSGASTAPDAVTRGEANDPEHAEGRGPMVSHDAQHQRIWYPWDDKAINE